MKEAVVGGVLAGLVGGSIIAGTMFITGSGRAVEVYGSVDVSNLPTSVYGSGGPILVELAGAPVGGQSPDGSLKNPFFVTGASPLFVKSCDVLGQSDWNYQYCNPIP